MTPPITSVQLVGGPFDGKIVDQPMGARWRGRYGDLSGTYDAYYTWEFDDFGITRGVFVEEVIVS